MDTLERLGDIKGNVRSTLEKLKRVKADLLRGNEDWRDWDFKDLLRELKERTDNNYVGESMAENTSVKGISNPKQTMPTRALKTHSHKETPTGNQQCVYCEDQNHSSVNCTKVTGTGRKRIILSEKRLCFSCTAESIARMNVRVDLDARNVVANTSHPFLAPAKTSTNLS